MSRLQRESARGYPRPFLLTCHRQRSRQAVLPIIEAEAAEESFGHQQRGKSSAKAKAIVVASPQANEPKSPKLFPNDPIRQEI